MKQPNRKKNWKNVLEANKDDENAYTHPDFDGWKKESDIPCQLIPILICSV
jgi:hypothetical protein